MDVFCQGTFQQGMLCLCGARGQMTPKKHGISTGMSEARCSRSALDDAILGWIFEILDLSAPCPAPLPLTPHGAEEGTKPLSFSLFSQVVLQTRLTSGAPRRRNQ